MGQFSWIAQNSNKAIIIHYYRPEYFTGATTHYMWDNKGNVWVEEAYEGYGMFGGKDYYVLLAEMNKTYSSEIDDETKRIDGIAIEFSRSQTHQFLFPNLTDCSTWNWKNIQPESDFNQGCYMDE
jgi:hypothetical protein